MICQSRLGGTKRHSLYKDASRKHKTQYKHIVHRDRYNNKTQIQQLNTNTTRRKYKNKILQQSYSKIKINANHYVDIEITGCRALYSKVLQAGE